jgi:predicted CXXCH cytochrome family protein
VGRRIGLAVVLLGLVWAGPGTALQGTAPLPWGTKASSTHAPYTGGDCGGCHEKRADGYAGTLKDPSDEMCLGCHEDARLHVHAPRKCVRCHNAHNAERPKLLRANLDDCKECHDKR